jgi:hypothetical protein
LRPNGFLHLRESCSEPSTGRSKTTMHSSSDQNPTHYRFSSVYIRILRNLRFQSDDGQWWRFDVQWASSVPTYIERQSNWRQVHWLAKKVSVTSPADGINIDDERLLRMFAVEWVNEQIAWDTVLDGEKSTWTDKIFERALASDGLGVVIPRASTVLCYNPRQNGFHVHLNAHWLAAQYSWNVWSVETNPFFYRTSLTKANTIKDSRVRFGWNETLRSAIEQWKSSNNALFNGFLAVEMLSTVDKSDVKKLTSILMTGSELVLLEPFDDLQAFIAQHKAVLEDAFEVVSVVEVSDEANRGQLNYFTQMGIAEELPQKRWLLIRGRVF